MDKCYWLTRRVRQRREKLEGPEIRSDPRTLEAP
jgi:hypothetical protein